MTEIRAAGGDVVAISADDQQNRQPEQSSASALGLTFATLSDPQRQAIRAYGLLNPGDANLSYPTVYVLDAAGTVRWRYIGNDLTDRPDTGTVVSEFRKAAGR